jgi:hypothetical protein
LGRPEWGRTSVDVYTPSRCLKLLNLLAVNPHLCSYIKAISVQQSCIGPDQDQWYHSDQAHELFDMLTHVDSAEITGMNINNQVLECLIQSLHGIFRSATKFRLGEMQFMQLHHWAQLMLQIPCLEILEMTHGNEMMLNALFSPASVPDGWTFDLSSHCRHAGKQSILQMHIMKQPHCTRNLRYRKASNTKINETHRMYWRLLESACNHG